VATDREDVCYVCGCRLADAGGDPSNIRESHHVVPRAYGGRDGPQVQLCIGHHDLIHLIATKRISGAAYTQFLTGEPKLDQAMLYLSSVIYEAHLRINNDPNKRITVSLSLSRTESARLSELADLYKVNRSRLLQALFEKEYSRVFQTSSKLKTTNG
jgi:hypothetical protein